MSEEKKQEVKTAKQKKREAFLKGLREAGKKERQQMGRTLYSTGVDKISFTEAGTVYDSGRFNIYVCPSKSDLPTTGLQPGYIGIIEDTETIYRVNSSLEWINENAAAWPVGSVFLLIPNTNPSELLGFGTWVEVQQDKLPVHVWRRTA